VRLVLVVLVAVLLTSASGTAATAPRTGSAGISISLPHGWHDWQVPRNLNPAVTDPLTRVVAVSAPFHFADKGCQIAAYAFPPTAVAIVVVEWTQLWHNARWTQRPHAFTSTTLPVHPPPAIECFAGSGGSAQFVDDGRHLGVYVLAGRDASSGLIVRARAVLNSLRVHTR
jgi:hypothetical protein